METMGSRIREMAKKPDTYRYLLFVVFFLTLVICGINFMNAGSNYQQAISFRPFCIAFGLMALTMMDGKSWLHIWSLVYLPVWYVAMRIGYSKHWITDVCQYEHVDVIRAGKLVALVWGLVFIAILRDFIKKKQWKNIQGKVQPVLAIGWLLYVIWITIFHRQYYYATFFLAGFTSLFWIMANNRERKKYLWRAMCDACLLSLVFVLYKSLRHRPYDTTRYMGYFSNSNMAGMYFACLVSVIFFRLDEWWHRKVAGEIKFPILAIYYLLFGFVTGLALFNYTRTTILGLLFAIFTMFLVQVITEKKKGLVFLRYLLALASVVALFQLTYNIIRYVPAKCNEPSYFDGEYDPETKIMPNDPSQSEKYTSLAEYYRIVFGKWGIYINFEEQEATGEEATVEVDTDRDVTNGRVEIWQAFLERTNFTGHYPGNLTLDSGYFAFHAHSTYIHILYQYGIPAGVLFALLSLGSYGYGIFLFVKKGKKNRYLFLTLMLTGVCLIAQVTEWIGHPAYLICLMQWLGFGMLLTQRPEDDLEKK